MQLYELTAHELGSMLRKKEISAVELARSVLERIESIESVLGCYITVIADAALESAREVQNGMDSGEELPPLAGIPIALKDNICTKGLLTTCASRMLYNFVPPYNATVAEKLAGNRAVLLGKTNMDEFAMGGSTEHSYFMKTRNPWDPGRVPGGSSGGSAAAVASGETIIALGTDTGGSIRQPASFCGVVGMKPTYGAVSRFGLIAFASSLDQVGPITKDVADCALVMNAICGHDRMDPTSVNMEYPDYTRFLIDDVKGFRIGIPREYMAEGVSRGVRESINNAIRVYESLGAICEEISLPLTDYTVPAYYIISSAEASSNLARYDGVRYGYRAENHDGLTDFYCKTRSEGFGTEVKRRIMLGTYTLSSGYYDAYYKKALKVRAVITEHFEDAFRKYDLIIGPTAPTTAYKLGEKIDNPLEMYLGDVFTVSANTAGLPAMSIPCGFDEEGMPVGMQLIGRHFDEGTLIRAAYAFERNTDFHSKRPSMEGLKI